MTSIALSSRTSREKIERWQQEISPKPEGDHGMIARMLETCLGLLRNLIQHSSPKWITTPGNRTLRQGYATLQLWEHGHGVAGGRLDDHLKRSTEVRQATIEILIHLCRHLLDGMSNFVLPQVNDASVRRQHTAASEFYSEWKWYLKAADENSSEDESDSGDDHEEEDSLPRRADMMIRRTKTYVNCLMGLGTALECPAPDEFHDDEPGVYPKAEVHLVQVLGKISWSRFLRMQRERDNNTAAMPELHGLLAPLATKSTGLSSEFQDSGIGTSLAKPQSSYAESTVSFMTSVSGGERVRIPPLPAEGKNGQPFECIACAKLVRAENNREWRKHLFSDLQPYNCFYRECHFNAIAFTNLQAWKNHLEFEHNFGPAWEAIECPLCLNLTADGKNAILTHFARHMEDVALLALPPAVEPDAESDTSRDTHFDINEVVPTPPRESEPARSPSNPPSSPHLNAQPRPQSDVPPLNWESGDLPNLQKISGLLDMDIRDFEQDQSRWESDELPVKQKIRELLDKKPDELEQKSAVKISEEWQHLRRYVERIEKLSSKKVREIRERLAKASDCEAEKSRNQQKFRELWDKKGLNDSQEPPGRADYVRYPIKRAKRTFEGDTTIMSGYLQLESFAGGIYLVVVGQNEPHNQLLREQLSKGIECRRAGEATLLCTQKNGTGLLLDFQDPNDCQSVWIHIKEAIDDPIHAYRIDSTKEPRELASLPHTNLTTPPEHATNLSSIAGGNTLIPEMPPAPILPPYRPYSWKFSSNPKSRSLDPDVQDKSSPLIKGSYRTSIRSSHLRAKQPQVEVFSSNKPFSTRHDLETFKNEVYNTRGSGSKITEKQANEAEIAAYHEPRLGAKNDSISLEEIPEISSSQSKGKSHTESEIGSGSGIQQLWTNMSTERDVVWFCSDCRQGSHGGWQNVCVMRGHQRCPACVEEKITLGAT